MKRLVLCLFLAGVIAGCGKPAGTDHDEAAVVEVKTASVRLGDIDETVTATGETSIQREAQLRSPISGVITTFRYFPGDPLKRGETVAVVMTRESQASMQGAEELLRAATTDDERKEAQAAIDLARHAGMTVAIKAPFDGFLSLRTKNEHEVVAEGEQVASVVDPGSVFFFAHVPAEALPKIRKGERALIHLSKLPGEKFSGVIQRIDPQVNQVDQTASAQIAFSTITKNLERGLVGVAEISVARRSHVLLTPEVALLHNDESNTTSLVIMTSDSLSRKVVVTVGLRKESLVEVSAPGLEAGTQVITEGQYGLPDSTHVRPLQ